MALQNRNVDLPTLLKYIWRKQDDVVYKNTKLEERIRNCVENNEPNQISVTCAVWAVRWNNNSKKSAFSPHRGDAQTRVLPQKEKYATNRSKYFIKTFLNNAFNFVYKYTFVTIELRLAKNPKH